MEGRGPSRPKDQTLPKPYYRDGFFGEDESKWVFGKLSSTQKIRCYISTLNLTFIRVPSVEEIDLSVVPYFLLPFFSQISLFLPRDYLPPLSSLFRLLTTYLVDTI